MSKNKGGRPPKYNNAMAATVPVRMPLAKKIMLEEMAAKAGMPVSVFLREAIFNNVSVRQAMTREEIEAHHNLANIGNNLNQLVHLAQIRKEASFIIPQVQVLLPMIAECMNKILGHHDSQD